MSKPYINLELNAGRWKFCNAVAVDDFQDGERLKVFSRQLLDPIFEGLKTFDYIKDYELKINLIND